MEDRIGNLIGEGKYRKVYEYVPNPEWVVKISDCDANYKEYANFLWLRHYGLARWVAPVKIEGGLFLQKRTTIPPKNLFPKMVPRCFCDLGWKNWGILNGKVVCHDYNNFRKDYGAIAKKAVWIFTDYPDEN